MSQSHKNLLLRTSTYTINFPSGYELPMNLPTQITIHELTQIMRSYSVLHNAYGLKHEGRVLQPRYLESMSGNVMYDCYLVDDGDQERVLGALGKVDFRVVYGLREVEGQESKEGFCAFRKYQFLGKIPKGGQNRTDQQYQTYIVRHRKTCHIYSIKSIPKKSLTFPKTQNLLTKLTSDTSSQLSSKTLITPGLHPIHETFQTQNSVCIVHEYYPFQLSEIEIDSKYLMDIILGQIGRILHFRNRLGVGLGIRLREFRMGFDFKVVYCGLDLEDEHVNTQGNNQFGTNMTKIFQQLLKNSNVRVIQLYIPLLHWLKNKRIITYIDFLKYSQINPNTTQQPQNAEKRKLILSNLIQSYKQPKIINLSQKEVKQFSSYYLAKTSIFRVFPNKNQIYSPNKKIYNKQNPELEELLENISTIKKKRQQIQRSPKPVYEVLVKRNKLKNKLKNKTKAKSMIQSHHTENRKTSKSKKHNRKISQFLIED